MSRARNIKPGFFENEQLAECNPLARLLFAGLWCEADREGRLEDRPKRIKVKCLPYDEVDVDQLLSELAAAGFICRYQVDGNAYIAVNEFAKHQNPHQREVASAIPAPNPARYSLGDDEHNLGCALSQPRSGGDGNCTGSARLIPDSLNLIPDSSIPPSPCARAQGVEVINGETGEITTGSAIADLTATQAAQLVTTCKALRKMGPARGYHPGDLLLAGLMRDGYTAEQVVRIVGELALKEAALWDDPDVHPELFELFINGRSAQDMGLTPKQHADLQTGLAKVGVKYAANTLRGRNDDAAKVRKGNRNGAKRPSATDSFEGKTYVGTPDDKLPPELRAAVEANPYPG